MKKSILSILAFILVVNCLSLENKMFPDDIKPNVMPPDFVPQQPDCPPVQPDGANLVGGRDLIGASHIRRGSTVRDISNGSEGRETEIDSESGESSRNSVSRNGSGDSSRNSGSRNGSSGNSSGEEGNGDASRSSGNSRGNRGNAGGSRNSGNSSGDSGNSGSSNSTSTNGNSNNSGSNSNPRNTNENTNTNANVGAVNSVGGSFLSNSCGQNYVGGNIGIGAYPGIGLGRIGGIGYGYPYGLIGNTWAYPQYPNIYSRWVNSYPYPRLVRSRRRLRYC